MSAVEILALERLSNTPGAELAVEGWLELSRKGFLDDILAIQGEHHALVAFAQNGRDSLPVGVMTWRLIAADSYVEVLLSYVKPDFRGRGIYTALWKKIVEIASGLGVRSVWSDTHVRNQAMRAIAARQGRTEEFVWLRYDIQR